MSRDVARTLALGGAGGLQQKCVRTFLTPGVSSEPYYESLIYADWRSFLKRTPYLSVEAINIELNTTPAHHQSDCTRKMTGVIVVSARLFTGRPITNALQVYTLRPPDVPRGSVFRANTSRNLHGCYGKATLPQAHLPENLFLNYKINARCISIFNRNLHALNGFVLAIIYTKKYLIFIVALSLSIMLVIFLTRLHGSCLYE